MGDGAYERLDWGEDMCAYANRSQDLAGGAVKFGHLDAALLIKHAYCLGSEGERTSLQPVPFYILDEPAERAGKAIDNLEHEARRKELEAFACRVKDQALKFAACSYAQGFYRWPIEFRGHAGAVRNRFNIKPNSPMASEET